MQWLVWVPHRRHLAVSQPEEPLGLEEPVGLEVQLLDQQVVAANASVLYQQLYVHVIPGPSP